MHEFGLILTITGSFAAALLFGYVTQRLGLSPMPSSPVKERWRST
jgi:monovalent cation:H+ antiporter-2, CPA2 family